MDLISFRLVIGVFVASSLVFWHNHSLCEDGMLKADLHVSYLFHFLMMDLTELHGVFRKGFFVSIPWILLFRYFFGLLWVFLWFAGIIVARLTDFWTFQTQVSLYYVHFRLLYFKSCATISTTIWSSLELGQSHSRRWILIYSLILQYIFQLIDII